jgi:DNA primase catalytic core
MSEIINFVEQLRSRITVSSIISNKVELKKRGREFTGLCPFHSENTPSFTVNDHKQFYHCFGCGEHGDIVGFVMKIYGLTFIEAVEKLAATQGLKLPKMSLKEAYAENEKQDLYDILQKTMLFFISQLKSIKGYDAREYLEQRKIDVKWQKYFSIGFAPSGNGLLKHLSQFKISPQLMQKAGLVAFDDAGKAFDLFRNRIIFPIFDTRNRVIAFGGRIFNKDQKGPKYYNSPETLVFHKGNNLYGENLINYSHDGSNKIIVTEGYMDVIALYKAGIENAVAPLGTAITDKQILKLWRISQDPIICLDGDNAGKKAAFKAAKLALPLLKSGNSLCFTTLPANKDPDDVINENGIGYFNNLLANTIPLAEYIWQYEYNNSKLDTPEQKALFTDKIYENINLIQDKNTKNYYQRFFQNQIWHKLNVRTKSKEKIDNEHLYYEINSKITQAELMLINVILHHENILNHEDIYHQLLTIDFNAEYANNLVGLIVDYHDNKLVTKSGRILDFIKQKLPENQFNKILLPTNIAGENDPSKYLILWEVNFLNYQIAIMEEERKMFLKLMNEESEKKAGLLLAHIRDLQNKLRILKMDDNIF